MNSRVMTLLILVILAGILLFAVIGYSFSKNHVNIQGEAIRSTIIHNQAGDPVVVDDGVIKVGVITPLSGEYAFIGEDAVRGFEVAKENLEMGGLKGWDVQVIYKDSSCDPQEAERQQVELQKEGIEFILSIDCYGNDLVGEDAVFVMTDGVLQADVYSFTTGIDDEVRLILDERPEGSTYVLFVDNPMGLAYADALKQNAKVVAANAYSFRRDGFVDLAKKVVERDPDRVFVVAMDLADLQRILSALREEGYFDEVLTNVPVTEEYLKSIGTARFDFESVFFVTDFDGESKRQRVQEFMQAVDLQFGVRPLSYAANAYDTLMILGKLIAEEGKNPVSVKESLRTLRNYEGVTGIMTFHESQVERTNYVRQILDGRIVG